MRPEPDGQACELLFDLGEAPAQTVALIAQRFRERHDDLEEQSLAVLDTRRRLGFDHLGGSQLFHATHDGALISKMGAYSSRRSATRISTTRQLPRRAPADGVDDGVSNFITVAAQPPYACKGGARLDGRQPIREI